MLLMVGKGTSDGMCHSVNIYVKANNKYMKDYGKKKKESWYLEYHEVNNFNGLEMSQNLSVNQFKWVEDIFEFGARFIKIGMKKMVEGVFLKLIFKKPGYNHMNPELRKKAKNDFEKVFLKPTDNSAFRKTMKNIHKHSVIKLVTGERRRNCFVPEANYHAATFFTKFCWL